MNHLAGYWGDSTMSAEHPDENLSRGFAINSSSSKIHEGEIQGEPATQSFRKSEPAAVLWLRLLSVFVRSQTERRIAERTNPASRPRLCSNCIPPLVQPSPRK